METRYPSRIDGLIGVPLFGIPVACLVGGIGALFYSVPAAIVLLAVGGFMGLAVGALSYPCDYILRDSALEIRKGIGEESVAYRDIKTVEPVTSAWAAQALSVYRVRIDCGATSYVISPKEREKFISDLTTRVQATNARAAVHEKAGMSSQNARALAETEYRGGGGK